MVVNLSIFGIVVSAYLCVFEFGLSNSFVLISDRSALHPQLPQNLSLLENLMALFITIVLKAQSQKTSQLE